MGLHDLSPDSGLGGGHAWTGKLPTVTTTNTTAVQLGPGSALQSSTAPGSLTPLPSPILSTRIVGALTDLVTSIYCNLEKTVITAETKNGKSGGALLNASSSTIGTPDQSDGEGSENNFNVLVAPGESSSSRLSDDSGTTDEQKTPGKPFTAHTPTDPTRGPPAQSDARPHSSWWFGSVADSSLAAQFQITVAYECVVKHRRSSGRWKKHLGDVFLQLGELEKAQLCYDSTIQLLRPIMDNLWVAGALEGMCAIAVAHKQIRTQHSDLLRSRRPLRSTNQRYAASERSHSRAMDSGGPDLTPQKQKPLPPFTASDYRNMATEALELYRKTPVDRYLLEETSYKIARFLISENVSLVFGAFPSIPHSSRFIPEGFSPTALCHI
ncbi:hypothetical protein FGIG_05306 [Fasciola gigantica]|uniref:Trs120/TRAPPC9 N-terminal domain-containing protein n=1 Tax=Fasciola gigantica TaxID=46835 RepID=A0A504YI59_FASGI|nr:hypothetical protein FGIG_05306 [Fasciola gigantica]